MARALFLAGLGVLTGIAAWGTIRRDQIAQAGAVEVIAEDVAALADMVMELPGLSMIRVSNMREVPHGVVDHRNVRAMLRVIRQGESSQGDSAYRMIVGGGYFDGWSDHPRVYRIIGGERTSAAGAYQITASTWDETRRAMGLADFSPRSQDIAAMGRIAYRGALNDVLAGRLATAIQKLRAEWTSLPGAAQQNRLQSMQASASIFLTYGGTLGESVA